MATIEQRLQALESKQAIASKNCIVIIKAGETTEAQQQQITEAEQMGQQVIMVELVSLAK